MPAALYSFARRHHVVVFEVALDRILDESLGVGVNYAPASNALAIHWQRKYLYVAQEHVRRSVNSETIGGIIHELGHLIASRRPPEDAQEVDFLGWEWLLARKLGLRRTWGVWMQDYVMTNDGNIYKFMAPSRRYKVLCQAVQRGYEVGNIARGRPVGLR